jgi:foldase protein PrsA
MQDFFKRFWFIIIVSTLFAFAIGYFIYDQTKDVLRGKKIDGNDIVFEINGQFITADEFYSELFDEIGISAAYALIERAVVEQQGDLTADIISEARIQADSTINSFKEYYGDDHERILRQALNAVGYQNIDELKDYFAHLFMLDELTTKYLFDNEEDYILPFLTSNKPRKVSHILIAMDDPNNPTEEEQNRWDSAIEALESGTSFEEVAKDFSDDTASAVNNGALGYMDANTNFVPEFLRAALALDSNNNLSEWIKTTYGYHIIRLDTADLDDLRDEDGFKSALISSNASAQQKMIWESAKALGIDFHGNDTLYQQLENYIIGMEDE